MTAPPRVHVTRRFVATLSAAFALVLGGLATGIEVLVLAGLMVGLVAALGAWAPRRWTFLASVAVGHERPREDEPFRVRAGVQRPGRGAALAEWRLDLPAVANVRQGATAGFANVGPAAFPIEAEVDVPLFGLHRVGPVHVRVGDAFGFAFAQAPVGRPADVRVYPRPREDDAGLDRPKQKRVLLGLHEVAQPGDGFEFFGLRDYHPGDRPRDVNWKASGRYGKLIVNQHERESNAEILVLLDVRRATRIGPVTQTPFAQGCRRAIALAEAYFGSRDQVRVVAYGAEVHEDRHTGAHRRLQGILDLIVGLEPAGDLTLLHAVERVLPSLKSGTPVAVVSPLVGDPTAEEALARLRSRDLPVSVYQPAPPLAGEPSPGEAVWMAAHAVAAGRVQALGIPRHVARAELPVPAAAPHVPREARP